MNSYFARPSNIGISNLYSYCLFIFIAKALHYESLTGFTRSSVAPISMFRGYEKIKVKTYVDTEKQFSGSHLMTSLQLVFFSTYHLAAIKRVTQIHSFLAFTSLTKPNQTHFKVFEVLQVLLCHFQH